MNERGYFNNLFKESRRQKTLKNRVSQAYLALRPILGILATGSEEWEDTPGYLAALMDEAGNKNPFVVDSDNDETYNKALKFLLEEEGNDLHNIAKVLIADMKLGNISYDLGVEKVKVVLSEKLDLHRSNIRNG